MTEEKDQLRLDTVDNSVLPDQAAAATAHTSGLISPEISPPVEIAEPVVIPDIAGWPAEMPKPTGQIRFKMLCKAPAH